MRVVAERNLQRETAKADRLALAPTYLAKFTPAFPGAPPQTERGRRSASWKHNALGKTFTRCWYIMTTKSS